MFRKLAIIGTLLVGLLVHVDAQETSHPAPKTEAAQQPSPSASPVVVKKNDPPALQSNTAHEQPGSEGKPFRIALPPRNKYDWIAYGASLLLVFVGIGGVAVGICTLIYLRKQAGEMRLQRKVMVRSLRAMRQQADLMERQASHMEGQITEAKAQTAIAKISADAAKASADIAAGVSIPTLVLHEFGAGILEEIPPEQFFAAPNVKITVKNYGQTPALLHSWSICFTCEDLPEVPEYEGSAIGMILDKRVVLSGDTFTLPGLPFFKRTTFTPEDVQSILKRRKRFVVYGYIAYADIFGNPLWRFKFCETVLNIYGTLDICDWWSGFGPTGYSGIDHFPVKRYTEEENPN